MNVNLTKIKDFSIGMKESYVRTIYEKDIIDFAKVTGDTNPVHLDKEVAEKSIFKKQVAHGMLIASFFSKIFGTKFPGNGCIYLSQVLSFRKPVFIGDTVTAEVTIQEIDYKKNRLFFSTECFVEDSIVISGTALIYLPDSQ